MVTSNGYEHYKLTSCGHDEVEGVITYEDHVYNEGSSVCSTCGFDYLEGVLFEYESATDSYIVSGTDSSFHSDLDLDITIPSTYEGKPVTSIGKSAFNGLTNIKKVILPDTITSILGSAFRNCSGLTSINFPEGLLTIGMYAFAYCSSLQEVSFPSSLYMLGFNTFASCSSLTELIIPETVTQMGNYCFFGCNSLASLTLGGGFSAIPEYCFYNAFVSSADIEVRIVLPDETVAIGPSAFGGNNSIRYVDLGENVYMINQNAFSNCTRLSEIVVPSALEEVVYSAFSNCSSLSNVYYRGDETSKANIVISATDNDYFINATWNYYSETEPTSSGNYWRFLDGVPTIW